MFHSSLQQIDIEIPTQKFIFVDNNLLIPLISLNAKQIYDVLYLTINKFKNLIKNFI